ncbi:MAG: hypothetical protein MJ240_07010 [Kiritimatiellae bacterium]|nr:hypothetical protein [Kiritimatiellia bacterium]
MKQFVILMMLLTLAGSASAQLRRGGMLNRRSAARPTAATAAAGAGDSARPAVATREELRNARGTNGTTRLVFNQTPIELVLESYAQEVGRTIIPAPDLPKATITLRSAEDQTLTKEEYLFAIEHILTMNGVVLEPRGEKFLRALARKTVRTQGIPMLLENRGLLEEKGQVVSQLISFHNIAVAEAQKALEGFKDPNGLFQVFERTNAILVTDTQENINRMLEIAKAIDIATPVLEDVFVRQIKFAVANDIKTALETIVTESQKETQAKEVGPKTSGGPGFGAARAPQPMGSRLLNLNNRPGNQPPPPPTPNETMLAAVSDADRGMIRGKVLILADERSNKLIVITMKSNMDFFDRVIETLDVETEPEFKVEVVRLKYAEAEDVESMLNDLIGGTSSSSSSKENKNQNAKTAANTKTNLTPGGRPGAPGTTPGSSGKGGNVHQGSVGDLSKDNCKVLADKRINGIVVMTRKELMPIIMQVIDDMDVKLSQVLIETAIIEISLGDELQTGIDWVQRGRQRVTKQEQATDSYGRKLFWKETTDDLGNPLMEQTTEDTGAPVYKKVTNLVRDGFYNNGSYMLGGGGGNSSSALQNLLGAAAAASTNEAVLTTVNPIGGGVNYMLKSDKLNLAAVIQASKTDARAKYVASPIVMTVDNKEAQVEATSARQFITGWTAQSSGNYGSGMPSPNYSQKDIGIKLKMTPKINPNGTIMLSVEEEYLQVGEKQSMMVPDDRTYKTMNIDIPTTRKMSSDVRLENRQTVVLGGLVEKTVSESEFGIPVLKDIPWIGKWLFGSVEQKEFRKELLVFLTPYVLDDESAAQLEALRRKKSLSDPRPWDDNGWSASPLADPVSKKEQLRRFQDEWKKQDEERKSRLAIEKAKVERARKLKEMSKDEREFWIKLHKDELEKEEKEAFEKQAEEQKDLKEFVETLKRTDMAKAEAALKEAEQNDKNEYRKDIEKRVEDGTPLPAGETLKKDAAKAVEEKKQAEAVHAAAKKVAEDAAVQQATGAQAAPSLLEDLKPEPKK